MKPTDTPGESRDPADDSGSGPRLKTWPFWAPSRHDAVVEALELAGVGPGTRVLDLGCGDGSALLVAAQMGAIAAGIEADADLAAEASQNLAGAGIDAEIVPGDLFDPSVGWDADVLFAYLAPATLQRLLPRFRELPGTVLVTVDFDVPGLTPTRRGDAARLYRLPGRRRRVGEFGWPTAGTLICTVPDVQSLSCLEFTHPAGSVDVAARWSDPASVSVATGADHLDEAGLVAVDLRWEEPPEATVVSGVISTASAGSHHVFMVATEHEEEAQWDLSDEGVANLTRALAGPNPPTSAADAVAAASRAVSDPVHDADDHPVARP